MRRFLLALALLVNLGFGLVGSSAHAQPMAAQEIPESLRPWIPWVLHDQATYGCTLVGDAPWCTWPGELGLRLGSSGGSFSLLVVADRPVVIRLPGDRRHWPHEVRVNGTPWPVLDQDAQDGPDALGTPYVRVPAGTHRIDGTLRWQSMPELLRVPNEVARVALSVSGEAVATVRRNDDGTVWLRGAEGVGDEEGHVELEVHRRMEDGVPFRVITQLAVRASGQAREMSLGKIALDGMTTVQLTSNVPVRLGSDGTLVAQVHAGSFTIEAVAVSHTPPESLAPPKQPAPWPEVEIWVWAADESLRQVELDGAPSIDPARTNLPEHWRSLPAYRLLAGEALAFRTTRRGVPVLPPNALSLERTLWLDLDGTGYTVRDRITGSMSQGWRLDLLAGQLGRVALGQEGQLVTKGDKGPGVELRTGSVDVTAEWRHERASTELEAVGWSEDVHSLRATLLLPPGWSLLGTQGVDDAGPTWVSQWNLWALFFVLLVAVAVGRLFGWPWGAGALATLALCYHEHDAPLGIWVWLLILVALARLRVPERLRMVGRWVWIGSVLLLLAGAVPFAVDQIKSGLYPQAGRPSSGYEGFSASIEPNAPYGAGFANTAQDMPLEPSTGDMELPKQEGLQPVEQIQQEIQSIQQARELEQSNMQISKEAADTRRGNRRAWSKGDYASGKKHYELQDPNAVIQTGPGVPSWRWAAWPLSWSGPVANEHRIRLWLVPPWASRLLAFARVALLAALVWLFVRRRPFGPASLPEASVMPPAAAGAAVLLLLLGLPGAAHAQTDMPLQAAPSQPLLDELRARLTAPPACAPRCVLASEMTIAVTGNRVRIAALVHAGAQAAYQVPGPARSWTPDRVEVNGVPSSALALLEDGFLFLRLPPGQHRVILEGPIPNDLSLAFGQSPPRTLAVNAEGWQVDGVRADGQASSSIQLQRLVRAQDEAGAQAPELPAWLVVRRRLVIGVRWTLESTVERITPTGAPVVVRIPLFPGESVMQASVISEKNQAVVSLGRDDTEVAWTSVLEPRAELVLTALANVPWSETWTLACSPIWHCEATGLAPVTHQSEGVWEPVFRPFPGDSVTLRVTRPEAVAGQSITIDDATLRLSPGVRMLSARLNASIRTSGGGTTALTLPEGARIQKLMIAGQVRPVQQEGRVLRLTLQPGAQDVEVEWREERGIATRFSAPEVRLGEPAVNARVEMNLPAERWILWAHGPAWGPAVLFWGYLILIVVIAIWLGMTGMTPLGVSSWLLLGLGLSQIPAWAAIPVAGWFFAMAQRDRQVELGSWALFDIRQLALMGLTLVAGLCLYGAVHTGLLLRPDMQVAGGDSYGSYLTWYVDRIESDMPQPWVLSVPMWVYRLIMLLWASWLAFRLVGWVRWGYACWSKGGVWRRWPVEAKPVAVARAGQGQAVEEQAVEDSKSAPAAPEDKEDTEYKVDKRAEE